METMVLVRGAGVVFGILLGVSAFFRFRDRRISRYDALMRWALALGVVVVALAPGTLNRLRDMMALRSHEYGRIFALLILSNLAIWALFFRERTKLYTLKRNFDRLFRSVAAAQATPDRLAPLPEGVQILVALPAYNEAENLPDVLARMPKEIDGHSVGVVVVDDGSSDDTVAVVQALGHAVVSSPCNRGQGSALRLGYDLARRLGALVVVTHDADGQHRPEDLPTVVAPILNGQQDFVIGSRMLGSHEKDSAVRTLGIHVYNAVINLLAGTRISDCSSGFKAIRVSCLDRFELREDQFQSAEAIIVASLSGLRIGEVPITIMRRAAGISKKGRNLTYGLGFTRSVLKAWWR